MEIGRLETSKAQLISHQVAGLQDELRTYSR